MECSTGNCKRFATIRITFIDNAKRDFCNVCAKKIGGDQKPIEKES